MSTTAPIVRTPDVLHGKPRIEGTRIGVFTVGELVNRKGWSIEKAAGQFDLERDEVEAAVAYYEDNPELMDELRAQRDANRREIAEQSRSSAE